MLGKTPATTSSQDQPGQEGRQPGAVRLRLAVSYDGSGFHGWARQPGLRTVQQVVEDALGRVLGLPAAPALTVAGRTDAGVHARGQVAHADVPADRWEPAAGSARGQSARRQSARGQSAAGESALRRLARLLPADVRVTGIGVAADGFDARFSALWRRYSYRVCTRPAGVEPLRRHDTLCYSRPLDLDRMNTAARPCLGEHDFAAFCRPRQNAASSTVRDLLRLNWAPEEPGTVVATVVADAFCHNMVRALVGALLAVGDGSRPVSWPGDLLAAGVRDPAVRVLPPHGLCLEEVGYPPDTGLAGRASVTRSSRR
jgi:tRNA pseudouridine38-40 synthase